MKRLLTIVMTLLIILAGCSKAKNDSQDINTQSVNEKATEGTTNESEAREDGKEEIASDNGKIQDSKNIDTDSGVNKSNSEDNKKILDKGYHDYEGNINDNLKIMMSLYPSGNEIIGSYFYDKERKEIQLKGKLDGNNIVLSEYDENGKNTGIFQGKMDANEKVEGTWISADGKRKYPFTLTLESIINGAQYGKRYAVAISDNKTDQDVEKFLNDIQSYVKNDNKEQLAELIAYPVKVKVDNEYINIENKDDFKKNYSKIFDPKYKEVISTAYTKYLFVNYQGIMFGGNTQNMWINDVATDGGSSRLLITALNK